MSRRDPAADALVIRRAQPAEAPVLRDLAIASKAYWGYADEWMARWASLLRLPPAYVRDNEVFVATRDQIVGFYALIFRGSLATLDHLWVLPVCIGQGVGGALFAHALAHAAQRRAQVIEIEADPNAVGFYAHMGARQVRETIGDMGRVLPIMAIDVSPRSSRR